MTTFVSRRPSLTDGLQSHSAEYAIGFFPLSCFDECWPIDGRLDQIPFEHLLKCQVGQTAHVNDAGFVDINLNQIAGTQVSLLSDFLGNGQLTSRQNLCKHYLL